MAGLVGMREEEKLARDVYLALYLDRGTPVFTKIARAEQRPGIEPFFPPTTPLSVTGNGP